MCSQCGNGDCASGRQYRKSAPLGLVAKETLAKWRIEGERKRERRDTRERLERKKKEERRKKEEKKEPKNLIQVAHLNPIFGHSQIPSKRKILLAAEIPMGK